jgi:hypothetical protein
MPGNFFYFSQQKNEKYNKLTKNRKKNEQTAAIKEKSVV